MNKRGNFPVVICDVDGVLAEWTEAFTALAATMGMGNRIITTHDAKYWDDLGGLNAGQIDSVWRHIKESTGFWRGLKPLASKEEFERIQNLRYQRDVYFVTSRVGVNVKVQTEEWLIERGIYDPTVVISAKKGEIAVGLDARWAIDDKASNAVFIKHASPETASYLLSRPYNAGFDPVEFGSKVRRIGSLAEFLNIVEAGQ